MSARAIVTGSLYRAAEERTSKNGKPFATFTLREAINGATRWWKAVAFNDTIVASVIALKDGEPVSLRVSSTANCTGPRGLRSRACRGGSRPKPS